MNLRFNIGTIIMLFAVLFAEFSLKAQQETITREKTVALWIYNVAYGVEWEDDKDMSTPFIIGVYGSKKVADELELLATNRPIKNKPVKIVQFKRYKDFEGSHILYVDRSQNGYLDIIFGTIKGTRTLMISDRAKNMIHTVINFLDEESGKRFEINDKNAEGQKYAISKTLLKLGGSKDILLEMYSETERELQKEREALEEQRKQIAEQNALLDEQQKKIDKQREEIKEKERLIIIKEEEVLKQNKRLDSMTVEIQRQKSKLSANLLVLNEQEKRIETQQVAYDSQKNEILSADKELRDKQDQLKEIDKKLAEKDTTIESQKDENNMLYGMLAVIGILLFFVIRNVFKQRKVNKKLNQQNIAINSQNEEIQKQSKALEVANTELEKLSIVASQTDNAVIIMDAQGNFEWVNAGFTRLYGFTLQLFTHEVESNIIRASKNPEISALIEKCIRDKETVVYEAQNKIRNGSNIWVQTTLTPTLDTEGNVSRLIAIDANIDKVKKAEREIREQHKMIIEQSRELERQNAELEKLSLVASETDNAILMADAEGDFLWVNDAYTRMFGYTFSELTETISKNIVGAKTPIDIKHIIARAKQELHSVDYEFQAVTKFGTKLWIHTTLTPITDRDGQLKYLIAIDTDITGLKKAEFEIRQKSEELFSQSEELRQQNERIEFQNQQITSSINYARNIQSAILPGQRELNKFFETFIIFKPKDIVSGDFYWFAHLPAKGTYTEKIFIATVDCTGHGVPGAFMSMISNQMLKEIVLERNIVKPKEILTMLDKKVKHSLRQDETENNDGMDVVLCRIERENDTYRVKFAGAKRPLYYYKNSEEDVALIRGDRRSIGGMKLKAKKIEFEDVELVLNKGDKVWLSTDGYIDQNNVARRRFGTPQVLSILNEIKEMPMNEQKLILDQKLAEYQGRAEQRDDITFIGLNFDGRW